MSNVGSSRIEVDRERRVPTVVRVDYKSVNELRSDYLTNLSLGGLFLRTNVLLAEGERVSLQLHLPNDTKPLEVIAEVRWLTPNNERLVAGAGVEFCDVTAETRNRLETFLALTDAKGSAAKGRIRLLLLETHPMLREVFLFEIRKLVGLRGWEIDIVTAEHDDEYRSIITDLGFHAAIIDLDEFQSSARQLIGDLRTSPLQRRTTVVLLSSQPVPALDDLKADTLFLRKPVSIQSLMGILALVADQNLQGGSRSG